jgi:predicted nucleotidyltransferase
MTVRAKEAAETLALRAHRAREDEARRAAEVCAVAVAVLRAALLAFPEGRTPRAWLIGSLAWGGFGVRSDVDVVVEGLAPRESTELELALVRRLGLPVDLLRFEELPESFRARVQREGVVVDA